MISTIDSESTSRSSVNDLSSWTSSTGTPATSLTISARSARNSSVVGIKRAPSVLVWDGSCVQISGQDDHLTGVDQAGAEANDQAGLPARSLAGLQQNLDGQWNRCGGGIALSRDIACHDDPAWQFQGTEHRVGDPHVRLMRREDVQVLGTYAGGVERLSGGLPHRVSGPLKEGKIGRA